MIDPELIPMAAPAPAPAPFIIFALPRSRTAWLASWLCHGGEFKVAHDLTMSCKSPQDFFSLLAQCDGTAETGAELGWKLIKSVLPKAKLLVIRRNIDEVEDSLAAQGVIGVRDQLEERELMLEAISALPGTETFDFADLKIKRCCKWIWEYLLGVPFDEPWWKVCSQTNIQIDMEYRKKEFISKAGTLAKLRTDILLLQKDLPQWSPLN